MFWVVVGSGVFARAQSPTDVSAEHGFCWAFEPVAA